MQSLTLWPKTYGKRTRFPSHTLTSPFKMCFYHFLLQQLHLYGCPFMIVKHYNYKRVVLSFIILLNSNQSCTTERQKWVLFKALTPHPPAFSQIVQRPVRRIKIKTLLLKTLLNIPKDNWTTKEEFHKPTAELSTKTNLSGRQLI